MAPSWLLPWPRWSSTDCAAPLASLLSSASAASRPCHGALCVVTPDFIGMACPSRWLVISISVCTADRCNGLRKERKGRRMGEEKVTDAVVPADKLLQRFARFKGGNERIGYDR
eukprot:scaffold307132_cov18-Tisochrysis_lutea.AAC.1